MGHTGVRKSWWGLAPGFMLVLVAGALQGAQGSLGASSSATLRTEQTSRQLLNEEDSPLITALIEVRCPSVAMPRSWKTGLDSFVNDNI
eukprot:1181312-Prorocentrum_minimum.AAC.8